MDSQVVAIHGPPPPPPPVPSPPPPPPRPVRPTLNETEVNHHYQQQRQQFTQREELQQIQEPPSERRIRRRPDDTFEERIPTPRSKNGTPVASPSELQRTTKQEETTISPNPSHDSMKPLDIDEVSSKSGGSWKLRIPWINQDTNTIQDIHPSPQTSRDFLHLERGVHTNPPGYMGGVMSVDDNPRKFNSNDSTQASVSSSRRYFSRRFPYSIIRSISQLSNRSSRDSITVESLNDFEDTEWTPQDSAYGAACPVCGCLPKNVRRAIELTIIALMASLVIFLVIRTSMWISAEAANLTGDDDNDSLLMFDDDYYVEDADYYAVDDAAQNQDDDDDDDDDYFDEDGDDGAADDGAAVAGGDDYYSDDDAYAGRYLMLLERMEHTHN